MRTAVGIRFDLDLHESRVYQSQRPQRLLCAHRDTVQSNAMTHWKLTLAYDGTSFHGWQIQPGLATVQGLLSDALFRIAGERVLPQGSGRTDAGVHALGQVASFSLGASIPASNLHRALNDVLPASVRVLAAENVSADFHARHSAVAKTYEYRIFPLRARRVAGADSLRSETGNICPPMLAPYVWPCRWPLDLDALKESSGHVAGEHDFTSFAASDPDAAMRTSLSARETEGSSPEDLRASSVRRISQSEWDEADGLLIYRVTANGFLHHMVRNLVGTFVECGAGRLAPSTIPEILAACNRSAAGPTAPASGLFLVSVEYPAQAQREGEVR
jgi:tRNA pseudouridine38-40 synthase